MHLHPLLPPSPLHHHPPLQGLRRLDLVVVGTVDCLFIDFLFFGGKMQGGLINCIWCGVTRWQYYWINNRDYGLHCHDMSGNITTTTVTNQVTATPQVPLTTFIHLQLHLLQGIMTVGQSLAWQSDLGGEFHDGNKRNLQLMLKTLIAINKFTSNRSQELKASWHLYLILRLLQLLLVAAVLYWEVVALSKYLNPTNIFLQNF